MNEPAKILFDMDGTLCDYVRGLLESLDQLRSPAESPYQPPFREMPSYLQARMDLIRRDENWWANLPRFGLGFDIWELAGELGFHRSILTQGPKRNPYAWAGKKIWIDNNLGQDVEITITRDKGSVYGRVLVDDFPGYVDRWLRYRPRGLVIMPASSENESYSHNQVIRYDGNPLALQSIRSKLIWARDRGDGKE